MLSFSRTAVSARRLRYVVQELQGYHPHQRQKLHLTHVSAAPSISMNDLVVSWLQKNSNCCLSMRNTLLPNKCFLDLCSIRSSNFTNNSTIARRSALIYQSSGLSFLQNRQFSSAHQNLRVSFYTSSSFDEPAASTKQSSLVDIQEVQLATNQLLEGTPLNTFTKTMFQESTLIMKYWIDTNSWHGANQATRLLQRILQEHITGSLMLPEHYDNIQLGVLLDSVLDNWKSIASSSSLPATNNDEGSSKLKLESNISLTTNETTLDYSLNDGDGFPTLVFLQLLQQLEEIYNYESVPYRKFISILTKYCDMQPHSFEVATTVERILDRMLELYKDGKLTGRNAPTTATFNAAISCWTRQWPHTLETAQRAVMIVNRMKEFCTKERDEIIQPNSLSYNMTITALARSPSTAFQAEELLQDMVHSYYKRNNNDENVKPDRITFGTVISALTQSNEPEAAERALGVLRLMQDMHKGDECSELAPNTLTYNMVIGALARSEKHDAATTAEALLIEMENSDNPDAQANTITYNSVLSVYAKRVNDVNAARRAESILHKMIYLDEKTVKGVRPDAFSFNSVIAAYAKCRAPGSTEKAAELLDTMRKYHDAGNEDVRPDTISMSLLLVALTRETKAGDRNAPSRAVALLNQMEDLHLAGNKFVKPDTISYTSVMTCMAHSKDKGSAQKAEDILIRMLKMYREGGNEDVKPDAIAFNAVLTAWANSDDHTKGAEKAERLLRKIANQSNGLIQPNASSYTIVIDAWAKSKDKSAGVRAEQLVNLMEEQYIAGNKEAKPNTFTYSSCIKAWSKSNTNDAAERATIVLQRMEDLYSAGDTDVIPNTVSYSTVIEAWANSPKKEAIAKQVESILQKMIYLSSNQEQARPNTVTFNTVLKAIGRSSESNKAAKAKAVLDQMKNMYSSDGDSQLKPNVRTYNSFLQACAFTAGDVSTKRAALAIAIDTLCELCASRDIKADSYTYPAALKCCEYLLNGKPENGWAQIQRVFVMCTEDGMVDGLFLSNLKNMLPAGLFSKLMPAGVDPLSVKLSSLPKEWKYNTIGANQGKNQHNKRFKDSDNQRSVH